MSNPSEVSSEEAASPAAVADELERIAASSCFRKAPRCVLLLRHLTNQTLEGRSGELKEYTLGVTVFDRPPAYDPRIDPIVRLEARRLRLKLSEYYQHEGVADPIVIGLPKGAYVPDFRLRQVSEPSPTGDSLAAEARYSVIVAKRRFPASLVAAGIVAIIFIGTGFTPRRRVGSAVRPSIAVVGFRSISAEAAGSWVGTALTETMNIDLGSTHQLRIVPAERVAQMRADLALAPGIAYSAADLRRISRNLDADYLVAGSYVSRGGQIRLEVQVFDGHAGRQTKVVADQGGQAELSEVVERCASPIRRELGSQARSFEARSFQQEDRRYPDMEPAAMESYARGMERLRQSDALGAREFLETATAEAPSSPAAHSALAAAWSMLGQDAKAKQEASLAFDAASELGRVEQLEIEGRYRTIAHEWARSIQIYQAIFTLLPDDLESGLRLASAQTNGGEAQNALTTVSALRRLPAPLSQDPRIDIAEAQAAGALSDFARTRTAAHAAAEKALKKGVRLQYARARLLESGAMQTLAAPGFSEVRAEARSICSELGDRVCVAAAFRIEANYRVAMGDLATAHRLYEEVLETADQIGNSLERLNALAGLGYTARLQGDLRTAEKEYRAAFETASEMGPMKSHEIELDLADVLLSRGNISDAQSLIAHALEVARATSDKEGVAASFEESAHALDLKGNFSESQSKYNEAIAILREVNEPYQLCLTLLAQGDALMAHGNIEAARANYEEAKNLDRRTPGGFAIPEIKMAFARLNLAEKHFEQAATDGRAAVDGFAKSGREGDRMMASAILARALVGEGKVQQAFEGIAQSPVLDSSDLPVWVPLEFQIAKGYCLARSGKSAEAIQMMDSEASAMRRLGLPGLEKEAIVAKQAFLK